MNELQRIEPTAPPAIHEANDLLQLAVEKGADVATLERLMVVRKELKAEKARESYFASLAAFQAECPVILRTATGHANRYRYAPLEKIVQKVSPLLNKHGFSHQEDGIVTDGWVEAVVTVTHRDGHSETKRFKVPTESNAGMSSAQKYGSAMTYATRYAFCAAFGIRTHEHDNDAMLDGEQTVTELKTKLWNLLRDVRGPAKDWTGARQWLVDEMCLDPDVPIQSLDAEGLRNVIDKATKKLNPHQK